MVHFTWVVRVASLFATVVVSASASAQSCPPLEEGRFTGTGGNYGWSVAMDGDLAIVGAGTDLSAWILHRDGGGQWSELRRIAAPPGAFHFGRAVAISGDTAVVGGAWEFGPGQWGPVAELTSSDAEGDDVFGGALALDGDLLVVGASGSRAGGLYRTGAAYVFERDLGGPDAWGELARLVAPAADFGDDFGAAVGISGGEVIVGAMSDDPAGSAHVFMRDFPAAGAWGHYLKLRGSSAGQSAIFGGAVAIEAATALVGARQEDPDNEGAAYVFAVDGPDCNINGVPDACDIQDGGSRDTDRDGVPDECSSDCDGDGVIDLFQIEGAPMPTAMGAACLTRASWPTECSTTSTPTDSPTSAIRWTATATARPT